MRREYSARAKIKRVNEAYQTKEQIQQNYIVVEWRQASSFQASILVLVPSGGGETWGEMRVWRAPLPGVRSWAAPRKRYSKFGVRKVCRFRFLAKRDQGLRSEQDTGDESGTRYPICVELGVGARGRVRSSKEK